jgi:hypothetical protein
MNDGSSGNANGDADDNTGSGSGSGGGQLPITAGAKLQHLLNVTETVIQEELALYRLRHGLTPPPAVVEPTAPVAVGGGATSGGSVGLPRSSSAVFNSNLRAPPKSPLKVLGIGSGLSQGPIRAASSEDRDRPMSSLAASLRRSRSAAEQLGKSMSGGIGGGLGGSVGRSSMVRVSSSDFVVSPESTSASESRRRSLTARNQATELITAES